MQVYLSCHSAELALQFGQGFAPLETFLAYVDVWSVNGLQFGQGFAPLETGDKTNNPVVLSLLQFGQGFAPLETR